MEIKKGERYLCRSTVVMDSGEIAYIKGKVYLSERDGFITDEQGDSKHSWPDAEMESVYFEKYEDSMSERVTLTYEQWKVILKELEERKSSATNDYHEIVTSSNKYFSAGCSEEKYHEFVEMRQAKMEEAANLYNDVLSQIERQDISKNKENETLTRLLAYDNE